MRAVIRFILVTAFSAIVVAAAPAAGRAADVPPVPAVSPCAYVEEKVIPASADSYEEGGRIVAIDGSVAIVGTQFDEIVSWRNGSASIFRYNGNAWVEEAWLYASDPGSSDWFGRSVAIDGEVAVVAAPQDDDGGNDAGSAYVFRYDGMDWVEETKLARSDPRADDQFGDRSVAIENDLIVVGTPANDDHGSNAGIAHVFRYTGGAWNEEAALINDDAVGAGSFGRYVAIDDGRIVVGASGATAGGVAGAGAAYVFEHGGTGWVQTGKIQAPVPVAGSAFGFALDIDQGYIVCGACFEATGGKAQAGVIHVFRHEPGGWAHHATLPNPDPATADLFGFSVGIHGRYVVAGAFKDDDHGNSSGSATLFKRTGGTWNEQCKLTASDAVADASYGQSVAIGSTWAMVGAPYDTEQAYRAGAAYLYPLGDPIIPLNIDVDEDGDIDTTDLDAFESCASGPGVAYGTSLLAECPDYDLDLDGDIDQVDFAWMQTCFSGDGQAYPAGCD